MTTGDRTPTRPPESRSTTVLERSSRNRGIGDHSRGKREAPSPRRARSFARRLFVARLAVPRGRPLRAAPVYRQGPSSAAHPRRAPARPPRRAKRLAKGTVAVAGGNNRPLAGWPVPRDIASRCRLLRVVRVVMVGPLRNRVRAYPPSSHRKTSRKRARIVFCRYVIQENRGPSPRAERALVCEHAGA